MLKPWAFGSWTGPGPPAPGVRSFDIEPPVKMVQIENSLQNNMWILSPKQVFLGFWITKPISSPACSSVASPICQGGQSERTFPIFAFSSTFFLFFSRFFPLFPDFWHFFAVRGGTLPPPLAPPVATPLLPCQEDGVSSRQCIVWEFIVKLHQIKANQTSIQHHNKTC